MFAGEGARATQHLRATRGLRPNQYFAVVEEWAAVCPSYSLSFGCVVRCDGAEGEFTDPNVLLLKSRSPVSEYNFSCQFSVAGYQFIERIWARREALYFCVG